MDTKICEFDPSKTVFVFKGSNGDLYLDYFPEWGEKSTHIRLNMIEARELCDSLKKILIKEAESI